MSGPDFITDKRQLIGFVRERYAAWWSRLEGVAPDATRDDGWTLADVVAHVDAWHRQAAERLRALARGAPDPGAPDVDSYNAEVRAGASGWTWTHLRARVDDSLEDVLDAAGSVPEERWYAVDGLPAYVLGSNSAYHYAEHEADRFS